MCPVAEVYLSRFQTSMMELNLANHFRKNSIIDTWKGPKYVSAAEKVLKKDQIMENVFALIYFLTRLAYSL